MAGRDRQQVSHVSRAIGLAFLAPDIVEMIVAGRQPITLTPERLKACRPLPLGWDEQRSCFSADQVRTKVLAGDGRQILTPLAGSIFIVADLKMERAMILVSAMYPNQPGSRFDREYYLQTHIPLVKERWGRMGLEETRLVRGLSTASGGEAPFRVMALFLFRSLQDFQSAAQAHAQEIIADVARFTDVEPIIQISEEFE